MRHTRQSKQNKGLVIDVCGLIQRLSVAGKAGTHSPSDLSQALRSWPRPASTAGRQGPHQLHRPASANTELSGLDTCATSLRNAPAVLSETFFEGAGRGLSKRTPDG